MKRFIYKLIMWGAIVGAIIIWITSSVKTVHLQQNCTGYLGLSCQAYSIKSAKNELGKSIDFLEKNNLTKGYTSAFWKTEGDNIGFFYQNLKGAYHMLDSTSKLNLTLTETNVILLRLRQTLSCIESGSETIVKPSGLAQYPENRKWVILYWLSAIFFIGGCAGLIIYWEDDGDFLD